MTKIYVRGLGAVSPAGWGVPALRLAIDKGAALSAKPLSRPRCDKPLLVREVPAPSPRPAFFAHPRLRRASPITLYAVGAALEALASAGATTPAQSGKLGLIVCILAGCVQYSHRFFDETLKDPMTASPLIFPETVFNAPASHLAALLDQPPLTITLLGDPATYLEALALAADWLLEDRVEGCLVVGAEETNWLLADVLWHFDHRAILAGGAGAVYLGRSSENSLGIELNLITDAHAFSTHQNRLRAAQRMRRALPFGTKDELLCNSVQDRPRTDIAEVEAWRDWPGQRISPKAILGEGLMAAGAWQCVAACNALVRAHFPAANVSIVGVNQKAIGARFVRPAG